MKQSEFTEFKINENNIITLDIETQRSAQEVGGWDYIDKMGLAVAVIHSTADNQYRAYSENGVDLLINRLRAADLIIGFNILRFDYTVLQPYTDVNLKDLPTFDILEAFHRQRGFRVKLDSIAAATLKTNKTADGMQSLRWWKNKEYKKVRDYCREDVKITKDIYFYGKKNGKIFYLDKNEKKYVPVYVNW